jgi:putative hydrolase of the HAD superfamily
MVVVSNIHYDIREHFRRHGLDRYVESYVLSFEHGCQKPDAEMYTRALDALEVDADRALMVGDTPLLDGGAADVGIPTYILPGPFRAGRRGARGLDAVLRLVGID